VATLLTGVGYIGAALVQLLAERSAERGPVVALDNFSSTSRAQAEAALPAGTQLVEGDVADAAAVARAFDALGPRQAHEPTERSQHSRPSHASQPNEAITVFHLAAQPSAAMAGREPDVTERSNLVGARVVLEAARDRGARVVFGGSFHIYGDELTGQTVDEETPYGRVGDLSHLSKVYVEQLARMFGGSFVSVRLGVVYGLSPIMKTTPAFMTVPNLFCQRAAHGDVLQVLEDRPLAFIHVRDAAEALLGAEALLADAQAQQAPSEPWRIVNAAPEVATIGHVARTVQRLLQERGASVQIQGAASSEAGFQVRSSLGLEPRYTLASGLGEALDFFLKLKAPR
jgi:nucleoside-diphosphate-sugar epimerase